MHADRTNRAVLLLVGLVLLAAGVAGLLTNLGVLSRTEARDALFDNTISRWIGDNGGWVWPVFAVVCAVVGLLCLRWIVRLVTSTDRAGDLTLPGDRSAGRTVLRSSAVTSAVTAEIEAYRGVDSARARLVGDDDDPDLVVEVTASRTVDIGALRRRIEGEAFAHARQVLDRPELVIRLDLGVSRRDPERRVARPLT